MLTPVRPGRAQVHGRKWAQLEAAVPTKTATQIKNYYQNYKAKVRQGAAAVAALTSHPATPACGLVVWQYLCLVAPARVPGAGAVERSAGWVPPCRAPGACWLHS